VLPHRNPLSHRPVISLPDLTQENLINYRPDSPLGKIINKTFLQAGLTPTSYLEVGSPQNACSLVQEGVGVALVDEFSAISIQSPAVVVRQVVNAPTIDICLLHLSTSPLSTNASLFAEEIRLLLAKALTDR
jgi:DNA-binding transcriptional LysR family regulator